MKSWKFLRFWKHYWKELEPKLTEDDYVRNSDDYKSMHLPPKKEWFKALELTPFESVKCVILGQDPYPTPGHAMGLAFSVYPHVSPIPRSLANIFREYTSDLGYPTPRTGDLTPWAKEGVLLLNTCLTVEGGKPGSHVGIGWEKLTYEIIRSLAERANPPVFCLWGKAAQEYKGALGEAPVICSSHPSPFSAANGFLGSRPFSRVNEYLGDRAINWRLP